MASPTGLEEPLNWARVLKHEFVHVLTLQQTDFRIPHWYTEALAVRSEGYPRPAEWDRLLVTRVPEGRLRNLDTLNLGFQRAENRDDWNFSYCLSSLYAQFMVDTFGPEAPAKLLDAYRRQLDTDAAIPDSFGVSKTEFERDFREYLTNLVAKLKAAQADPQLTPAEIARAYEDDPANATAAGRYAQLLLLQQQKDEARELAEDVLSRDPHEPHAALVLASLKLDGGEKEAARDVLTGALNREAPQRRLLAEVAKLDVENENFTAAAEWYRLGRTAFPGETEWLVGTVTTARKLDDGPLLKSTLETLCEIDYDSAAYPLERARLAVQEEDWETARKYGIKSLHVDVLNVAVHEILGRAQHELGQLDRATDEYHVALELKPNDPDLQVSLAECYVDQKRPAEARELIEAVLKQEPDHTAAKALSAKLMK